MAFRLEVTVRNASRSFLIFPVWGMILIGSAAFLYCAYAGLLGG
jgi:hypothetical protein|tara:strand:+ start:1297 stop:1428 length:132 start_codon:yes stop_codon:yes gene_type:complete